MGRRIIIGIVLAVIAVSYTYFSSEEQDVPVTGRQQRVAMSDEQQQQLGLQAYDQTLAEEQENVVSSGAQHDQVQRVAKRIAKVGGEDKPEFDWDVTLLQRDEANAFCLPGGKIVVFTGLLDVAKTDDELATVMAHEVAHAVAEHGAERIFREQLTSRAVTAASGAFADDPQRYVQVASLLGAGAQFGLSLPWSRAQESESDHIGLIYMARAGYKPEAAITFWTRMSKAGGGSVPEYLATHPSGATRIKQIQGWIPEAKREAREDPA
ncbi:MAG: Peptidase Ste24p precursor [Thermoleophilia bacterium]|nr:Peptidase Ste24p precursor [Thermoleophilia bacterium]MCZ4496568.1 Peptidase Ste24p precursor [Thermoleophilia bacterium]